MVPVLNVKNLIKLQILKISIEICLVMKTRRVLVTIIILVKRVLISKLLITVLLQVEIVRIILV